MITYYGLPCRAARDVLSGVFTDLNVAFLTRPVRPDRLRFDVIATCTTGEQHLEGFKGKIISLAGDPILETITATAEHTIGLIWAITRGPLYWAEWDRDRYPSERMWSRMSLCVVGRGRLGKMVQRMGYGVGLKPEWDFRKADIVSLHVDLNETSKGLVHSGFLSEMKPGSYLINTARGEVIDDADVIAALKSRHLAGYAADVLSGEFEEGFEYWDHPMMVAKATENIVLTPHVGGSTRDAWEITQVHVAKKLKGFVDDRNSGAYGAKGKSTLETGRATADRLGA